MKKLLLYFIGVVLISGCSTCPPAPESKTNLFAIQVLSIEAPSPLTAPVSTKDVLDNSEMRIYEFPVTYAEVGKPQLNDQSYYVDTPKELAGFDGKYTTPSQESVDRFCEIQILNAMKGEVTYSIIINHMEFIKFAPVRLEDGEELVIPHFDGWQICTEVTQPLNEWNILDGHTVDPEGNVIKSSHFFFVRIIPPKQKINDTSKAKPALSGCRYYAATTINPEDDISPAHAIDLAKAFVEKSQRHSLDIKSARVLSHTPYEWDIRFDDLKWKGTGTLPDEGCVSIDKKTGKAKFQPLM